VTDIRQRLFDAYRDEVARIDQNGDGIVAFEDADAEDTSDGGQSNQAPLSVGAVVQPLRGDARDQRRPARARFAPSQRAWVLSGEFTLVSPPVNASIPQDADNR